ncbi:hypothetical protein EJ08DRAFT_696006 [Tothia fuscella]|uniref:Mitochondrial chaperone BCS1-like ATPase lid domain-containing protein n=1 Tax=Tothia fuscella TaxID=1048955 RepID=A0A9P4TZP7_9PEZI|nr:hypothetical protein EJ08DRAFT_696006 [Tothia fuscella]
MTFRRMFSTDPKTKATKKEIEELSKEFGAQVKAKYGLSPASIQGYCLDYRGRAARAVAEFANWKKAKLRGVEYDYDINRAVKTPVVSDSGSDVAIDSESKAGDAAFEVAIDSESKEEDAASEVALDSNNNADGAQDSVPTPQQQRESRSLPDSADATQAMNPGLVQAGKPKRSRAQEWWKPKSRSTHAIGIESPGSSSESETEPDNTPASVSDSQDSDSSAAQDTPANNLTSDEKIDSVSGDGTQDAETTAAEEACANNPTSDENVESLEVKIEEQAEILSRPTSTTRKVVNSFYYYFPRLVVGAMLASAAKIDGVAIVIYFPLFLLAVSNEACYVTLRPSPQARAETDVEIVEDLIELDSNVDETDSVRAARSAEIDAMEEREDEGLRVKMLIVLEDREDDVLRLETEGNYQATIAATETISDERLTQDTHQPTEAISETQEPEPTSDKSTDSSPQAVEAVRETQLLEAVPEEESTNTIPEADRDTHFIKAPEANSEDKSSESSASATSSPTDEANADNSTILGNVEPSELTDNMRKGFFNGVVRQKSKADSRGQPLKFAKPKPVVESERDTPSAETAAEATSGLKEGNVSEEETKQIERAIQRTRLQQLWVRLGRDTETIIGDTVSGY